MNKQNKILFLGHFPPPYHGVAAFNKALLESDLAKTINFDFLAINTADSFSDIEKFSLTKLPRLLKKIFQLKLKLLTKRYCCCYFSLTPTGVGFYKDLIFVFLLKVFRVKIIYHLHGKGIAQRHKLIERKLYQWCFNHTRVIILGQCLTDDLVGLVDAAAIEVLPNALTATLSEQQFLAVKQSRMNHVQPNLLFLANMVKSKGVFDLLKAAKILHDQGYNFKLSFAGSWFDIAAKEFFKVIADYNLKDTVEYLGFKSGAEKQALLAQADIFVYPTCNDTLPLVILEAMEFSLPIITTYQGAIPEVVLDKETGYLVKENDFRQLALKIEQLIKDQPLRLKFGAAGQQRFLAEYTYDKFQSRLKEILLKPW